MRCMLLCTFFGGYCVCKNMRSMNRIKLDVTVQNILALASRICALLKLFIVLQKKNFVSWDLTVTPSSETFYRKLVRQLVNL